MILSVIIKKDTDGSFVAITPTMPKCISRGKNAKEALDEHRLKIRTYLVNAGNFMPDSIQFHIVGCK